jgi:hypothetical protein
MDYALAKSCVKLKTDEKTTVTMQRILMVPGWSAIDGSTIGIFEEGNYHWNITITPCKEASLTGHVISTQVTSVVTDTFNPHRCTKAPLLGTVQPFIQDPTISYTTSGLTFLCCSRFEVILELINYLSVSSTTDIDVEVSISIGKVVPFIDDC